MEKIIYNNSILAIHISAFPPGTTPHTEPENPIGVLTLRYPKDHTIPGHIHIPIKRTAAKGQECIIVKKGKLQVKIYSPDKVFVKTIIIKRGELLLTLNGGHEYKMLEDSEIWEIKNGPYIKDREFI